MVLPLLPIIAGGALLGGGAGIGWGLGKGKKETITTTYAPTIAPVTTTTEAWQYAPVQTYAPTVQYQIQSPQAQQISKKVIETVSKPAQAVTPTVTPSISPAVTGVEAPAGISTGVIAIAVVGLVAVMLLKKKK